MSKAEPDFTRSYTEEEYLALDTDERIELIDGKLIVSPPPNVPHQLLSIEIATALRPAAAARKVLVIAAVGVRLAPGRIAIPDFAVFERSSALGRLIEAPDVLLIGEITSPGNASYDRYKKMRYYAESGIPWYLLVEPDFHSYETATLGLHRLEGDHYVLHSVAEGAECLTLEEPFPLKLRPADLYVWRDYLE